MKAIEILFNEIDKLNSKIKLEDRFGTKIEYLPKIESIIAAINAISNSPYQSYNNDDYF